MSWHYWSFIYCICYLIFKVLCLLPSSCFALFFAVLCFNVPAVSWTAQMVSHISGYVDCKLPGSFGIECVSFLMDGATWLSCNVRWSHAHMHISSQCYWLFIWWFSHRLRASLVAHFHPWNTHAAADANIQLSAGMFLSLQEILLPWTTKAGLPEYREILSRCRRLFCP